jgi:nucleoporin GLE1
MAWQTAGFRLHQVYPKPFMKLLQAVVSEFLVSLKNHDDADAKAVVYRLETYLHTGQFKNAPEGRNMPVSDVSSQLRA